MSVQGRVNAGPEPIVVRFEGELDAGDSSVAGALEAEIASGANRLIVDMVNVSFIDSSVIRALILAHRNVTGAGGWLRVVYTHHVVRRVIDMCGLTDVFPQYPTIQAAVRDLPSPPPSSETDRRRS